MTFYPVPAKNPALAHVLVVDDEPLIRWSLAETLTDRGHTVTEAGDGKEALRVVTNSANRPNVVLLDYRLPDSNDLSLFTAIKRELPKAPIILMTAYGSPEITAGAPSRPAGRSLAARCFHSGISPTEVGTAQ